MEVMRLLFRKEESSSFFFFFFSDRRVDLKVGESKSSMVGHDCGK